VAATTASEPKPCELCPAECERRTWLLAPNLMVCPACATLAKTDWRRFHDAVLDRFGAEWPKVYPEIKD